MKQKHQFIFLAVLFFCPCFIVNGQTIHVDKNQKLIYNNLPQEEIFVHYNSSSLFTGDYLFYKIYCINSQTQKTSKISKIGYVELIGQDKKTIFRHKIILKSGVGQGDFFIPTSVATGHYKLIAYTNWMKNIGNNNFFQGDVYIINPFIKNTTITDNLDSINSTKKEVDQNTENVDPIAIDINTRTFKKRENVKLELLSNNNKLLFGNYSISVRKIDSVFSFPKPKSINYKHIYPKQAINSKSPENLIILPELRGELISGILYEKHTKNVVPLKHVTFSISDTHPIFKSAITNNQGIFYFNVDNPYDNLNADLHVFDENPEKYDIELIESIPLNYNDLVFNDLNITRDMEKLILDHSINNQIENAYSIVKQHVMRPAEYAIPFYEGQAITYNLDDYTRFKSVKETIVEIINNVSIERRKGENRFKINIDQPNDYNLSSLIIVDGLLVLNHDDLLNYDARKIQKISVVTSRYEYGANTYEGVLSVETIKGDFKNYISKKYIKSINLKKPQTDKIYFNQVYNDKNDTLKRIPDYRSQLYWEPNFNLNKEENTIIFYTSDYIGKYEISIEGFTNDGVPISLNEYITVK